MCVPIYSKTPPNVRDNVVPPKSTDMLTIANIHQSESGWTVISFAPHMDGEILVLPEKHFVRTELLEGIELTIGMQVRV